MSLTEAIRSAQRQASDAELERLHVLIRHYERALWLLHGLGPISAEKYAAGIAGEALKGPESADFDAVLGVPEKDMMTTHSESVDE